MNPSTQLLTMLIIGYSAILVSFAMGIVYFMRFRKTKNKRHLWYGIIFTLCVPASVFLIVYGGCAWVLNDVDKGTIKEPSSIFQR